MLAAADDEPQTSLPLLSAQLQAALKEDALLLQKLEGLEAEDAALLPSQNKHAQGLALLEAKLQKIVSGLIRLGRLPPELLWLRPQDESALAPHHTAMLLRSSLPSWQEQATQLKALLAEMAAQRSLLQAEQQQIKVLRAQLKEKRQTLAALMRLREMAAGKIYKEENVAASKLAQGARNHKELMAALNQLYTENLVPPPRRKNEAGQAATLPRLKRPVSGKIRQSYGAKDADGVLSEGVVFTTLPLSPVLSALSGRVVFAGSFRGYGNLVIVQAGDVFALVSGLSHIAVSVGESLKQGDALGLAAASDESETGEIYLELRQGGKTHNPLPLFG